MKNLRNILKGIALMAVATIALSSCNNKAPFERLAAAVDSTQAEYTKLSEEGIPSLGVDYDMATNTVVYIAEVNADLSQPETELKFKAQMPVMEAGILSTLLTDDRYNLGKEIICAEANVKLELKGTQGGNLETTIDNSKVLEAYDAVFGEGSAAKIRASQND